MGEQVTEGYGTCPECGRLKHVTAEATLRLHNRFEAQGSVVAGKRCAGSGAPSVESSSTDSTVGGTTAENTAASA